MPPIFTNVSGTYKTVSDPSVNVGGTYKALEQAYVRVGGAWKELLQALSPVSGYEGQVDLSSKTSSFDSTALDITFKPDGTKVYVANYTPANRSIAEFSLSTAWDLSTATLQTDQNLSGTLPSGPTTARFSSDGTKMYCSASSVIYQFNLSTAWDISTQSYSGNSFDVGASVAGSFRDFDLRPGETEIFIVNTDASNDIYRFDFGTAQDISTLQNGVLQHTMLSENSDVRKIQLSPDGLRVWLYSSVWVLQGDLSTAYDMTTLTINSGFGTSLVQSSRKTHDKGFVGGGYIFIPGDNTNDDYDRYTLTGDADDIGNSQNPTVLSRSPDLGPTSNFNDLAFFDDTGDNLITSTLFTSLLNWPMTTPFDLSTIQTGSVTSAQGQDAAIDRTFKADGTRTFYGNNQTVYHDNFSTPWDISTISFGSSFDCSNEVGGQNIFSMCVSDDGLKMYVSTVSTPGQIYQYTLGTAYDVSTAVFDKQIDASVLNSEDTFYRIRVLPGGQKMLNFNKEGTITEYDMTTPYDIATLTFNGVYTFVGGQTQFRGDTTSNGMTIVSENRILINQNSGSDFVVDLQF